MSTTLTAYRIAWGIEELSHRSLSHAQLEKLRAAAERMLKAGISEREAQRLLGDVVVEFVEEAA